MKRGLIYSIIFALLFFGINLTYAHASADKNITKDKTIKNKFFEISIPNDLKGSYEVITDKETISVFHKESKADGFGGFCFGIRAYKSPADYASLPGGRKIGELTNKRGVVYDVVFKRPTDVQHNYVKNPEPDESFKKLYDLGDSINIHGIKGYTFNKEQGTKGKNLYGDVLKKHITAINEKWDSTKLESENMSYMYNIIESDKVGYTYYDVNNDGIDELLIGEIADGVWKGIIYDIYTMVNRKPAHVLSGGNRNRYYVCDECFLCNEYSNGADENGMQVSFLRENSTELFPQVEFKYDGYGHPDKPWFISYGTSSKNVTEEVFNKRKSDFSGYYRFDFTPLMGNK